MAKNGVPKMPDLKTLQALGFTTNGEQKDEIKKILRINDEQVHCNRFQWYNLPRGINGNMIERCLYYFGSVAWFYIEPQDRFVVLPFVLNGDIDLYGRYTSISPIPAFGSSEIKTIDDAKKSDSSLARALSTIKADVLYDPVDYEDLIKNPDVALNSAVILNDYTPQISNVIIPKRRLTEQIIEYESVILPYINTALMSATGIAGLKVADASEWTNVETASRQVQYAAVNGIKWIPIDGNADFQELTGGQVAKAEEFLLTMQSLDNFRISTYHGIESGGLFEKKAHTTDLENSVNMGRSNFVLDDATWNRQHWCDLVNSITGLGIWCEPKETAVGMDYNMDGMIGGGTDEQMVDATTNEEVATDADNG